MTSRLRESSLTGSYSQDGKTERPDEELNGKPDRSSTASEDQHGMTPTPLATDTREVAQPSRTKSKNSVLSEPIRTLESKQLDGPLRKSNSKSKTKAQSNQLNNPLRSQNNTDRPYYKPSNDTKTYYINSQGHFQSRDDPPGDHQA